MDPTKAVIGGCVAVAALIVGGVWYANLPPAPPKPIQVIEEKAKPEPLPDPNSPEEVKKREDAEAVQQLAFVVETMQNDLRAALKLTGVDPETLLVTGKDKIDNYTRIEPSRKAFDATNPIVLYVHIDEGKKPQLMMRLTKSSREPLGVRSAKMVCGDFSEEFPIDDPGVKTSGSYVDEWGVIDLTSRWDVVHALASREQLTPIVIRFRGANDIFDAKPSAKNMRHVAAVLSIYLAAHAPGGQEILKKHQLEVSQEK